MAVLFLNGEIDGEVVVVVIINNNNALFSHSSSCVVKSLRAELTVDEFRLCFQWSLQSFDYRCGCLVLLN